jgi:hypothetical protein
MQMLARTGEACRWEPQQLQLRIFSDAGRIVRGGRRLRRQLALDSGDHRSDHPLLISHPARQQSVATASRKDTSGLVERVRPARQPGYRPPAKIAKATG